MQILDCTLRDGGYYTNWDFDEEIVEAYLAAMEELPVDIIEVGYRSKSANGYIGKFFYCPLDTLKQVRSLAPSKKVAIMFNEVDISPGEGRELLGQTQGLIDIVRLAVKPHRFDEAMELAAAVKEEGYQVGFNLMYMSRYKDSPEVLDRLPELNGLVDYLNLVDSYGGIYPSDVRQLVKTIRPKVSMKLGFHGHNNLELAFVNSITAVESGCDIVDGTITGMGRGAGNLKTELLLTWLKTEKGVDVDFNALSDVVSRFQEMQEAYGWGTKLPYMVSGVSSLPQQEVMDWVTKRYYSMNSIIRALQNQQAGSDDNLKLPLLENRTFGKALIIGGGPGAVKHQDAVREWVRLHSDDLVIIHASSRNAKPYESLDVPQFYCLVGNEGYRLESVFENLNTVNGSCVLPPYPRKMGTYIPKSMRDRSRELDKIDFSDRFADSPTAIALQCAKHVGAEEVYAVGYDGYAGDKIGEKEKDLLFENDYLFEKFREAYTDIESLTPTVYDKLKKSSIYRYLD